MISVAYLDHSYHQRTCSTNFLIEILERCGCSVQRYWEQSWCGGPAVSIDKIKHHDVIIAFQQLPAFQGNSLAAHHPNIVFIPMFDSWFWHTMPYGGEELRGVKILNFSYFTYYIAHALRLPSAIFRYYKKPAPHRTAPANGLHGFFWCRQAGQVDFPIIKKLMEKSNFDSFHLHLASDPGTPAPTLPDEEEMQRSKITVSTWFDDKAQYDEILGRANVFFAPRKREGIGMAMLEALGCGQCVVSPDMPTMNEYILHGVNGLLYDLNKPTALDFSNITEIGHRAWEASAIGYQNWLASEKELIKFVLSPVSRRKGGTHA